jgi:peptidyl-prolyl cis-trans isomerase A (cyclophilin A)
LIIQELRALAVQSPGKRFAWLLILPILLGSVVMADEVTLPADLPFEPGPEWPVGYYARIETDMGRIVARLLPEQAPQSVAHFVGLAMGELVWTDPTGEEQKFNYYDGIPIHNIRAGFMFEVGDWTGTGKGAPPLSVPEEGKGPINFSQAGVLGMARPSTRPSAVQFFATYASNPRLNNVFPCFGEVVEGLDVILQISRQEAYNNGKPVDEIKIQSIRVFVIGDPPPIPEPRQAAYGPKRLERVDRE